MNNTREKNTHKSCQESGENVLTNHARELIPQIARISHQILRGLGRSFMDYIVEPI